MSGQNSYEDYEDENFEGKSIHSLEKRRIVPQPGPNDSESGGSVHIDSTLSPSPEFKSMKFDLQNKAFLKRMNSNNVESDGSPEDEKKKSKLNRMDSYEVSSKPQQYSMRKSPDARKKASMSPDFNNGRLASPDNQSKATKTSTIQSLLNKIPKDSKK
jgi:hypothetical protein